MNLYIKTTGDFWKTSDILSLVAVDIPHQHAF